MNSDIYKWLNGNEFLNKANAFSPEEKGLIEDSGVGSIFLLSVEELEYYREISGEDLDSPMATCLRCYATDFAKNKHGEFQLQLGHDGCPDWWTRTRDKSHPYALVASGFGTAIVAGSINHFNVGVRPAVWLNL